MNGWMDEYIHTYIDDLLVFISPIRYLVAYIGIVLYCIVCK